MLARGTRPLCQMPQTCTHHEQHEDLGQYSTLDGLLRGYHLGLWPWMPQAWTDVAEQW